ncbi:unnamed protein product [Bursaphelenchus okinawaensis]|uniref:Uncharacterized protein n=1 Tax=Bursaphelenchus okinawaensis TaxID=465554 RepID=A0A811L8V9_9BILA|nr:unnamed protein product [Bursaphelenchus okinawaensis]CAG9119976.1 unnamed protein product [Bursaphelenchus okinawaensis]
MVQLRSTCILALMVVVVYGVDTMEKRRNGRPMNPYSWQNRGYKIKRSLEQQVESENDYLPEGKRAPTPRNPYSWLARSQKENSYEKRTRNPYFWNNQDFLLDSLFRSESKKSPYMAFNGRRARNPYSWMNFV